MGRSPSNNNSDNIIELKKGPWTPEEDEKLVDYIQKHGQGSWQLLPKKAGINRCGKSCRLRWTNYLRPDIKRGNFSPEEEQAIIDLHSILGNKWSMIATHLPGRTDNEIKNFWNTHIRKKLLQSGIDPQTHLPIITTHDYNNNNIPLNLLLMNILPAAPFTLPLPTPNLNNLIMNPPLENLAKIRLLHDILLLLKTNVINAPNFSSQYDLNKIEGFNTGILLNNVNTSSMVPNLEYINNLDSNSFQPVSDTFMTIPEIACAQNKAIFNYSSNSNSDTTSEFSLPALLSPKFCCSGKQVDHYYGNYDQMFMDNCNNAADTCLGTLKDTNEASTSTSNSFWKDIFIE